MHQRASEPSYIGDSPSVSSGGAFSPEMDSELSISLVIILVIGGVMVTALLACYACIFRDLCCRQVDRSKRHRNGQDSPGRGSRDYGRPHLDQIALNDITQADSMPTESEKV